MFLEYGVLASKPEVKVSIISERINFLGNVFDRFISAAIVVSATKVQIYFHKADLVAPILLLRLYTYLLYTPKYIKVIQTNSV